MKETVKGRSARFKTKVLARWRWLAARGVDVDRAAQEIGVESTELRAWAQVGPMTPLVVPVHVDGETMVGGGGGLVAVLAGGVRIEGLTIADVAELARRLS